MKKLISLFLFVLLSQTIISAEKVTPINIENTDYIQILFYGQSLSMGWESPRAITTTPLGGNYMIGNNVIMQYNNGEKTLYPLVATKWTNGGEQPVVGCVNSFSEMYRNNVNAAQKFIGMNGGEGGQTIERLSKECMNGTNYYNTTFIKTLDNTLSALSDSKSTVSCPAIVYMQGEFNCDNPAFYTGLGMWPGTDGTTNKNIYKYRLMVLKENMQNDIMKKYGQKNKPLFFIYQTSGGYISSKEMAISMAQYEFAQENDDVIMLNPHYGLPDYGGGHLSTNGYRWYGELVAQTLYDVLVLGKSSNPVYPQNYIVNNDQITIDYYVPSPPLVLDTLLTPKMTNYGFSVYDNGTKIKINSVKLISENKVKLTCERILGNNIEIVYAGQDTQGSGNLRDSEQRVSMYTYYDDSSDAIKESYTPLNASRIKIYGSHYPMYNWSIGFYKNITLSTALPNITENEKLIIYPNPIKDKFTIINKKDGDLVYIYNHLGILLKTTNENYIDISAFASGIYLLKVNNVTTKILKK